MKKKWTLGGILILTSALVLSGCGANTEGATGTNTGNKNTDSYSDSSTGSVTEVLEGEIREAVANIKTKAVDYEKAVYVTLAGKAATVTAIGSATADEAVGENLNSGLRLSGGILYIEAEGDYILTGDFKGQVQVNATAEDKVHLVLNGVNIFCDTSSAIYGAQSDRIYITLAEGTANVVSDGSTYSYEEAEQDEPNAAIFSKDDLTFDGTGSLVVKGNYSDGIRSKDDLAIVGGSYEIEAVKDALQGKDSVCITDGNFILKSGSDAIKASNDTEAEKGYVVIDGGTFSIQAGDDAVHGESGLLIDNCKMDILSSVEGLEAKVIEVNGGEISVTSSDDGINAAYSASEIDGTTEEDAGRNFNIFGGKGGFGDDGKGSMVPDPDCKVAINGGVITIFASGDGIDSNGPMYINGGEIYVEGTVGGADSVFDYGTEAIVTGGTVVAVGAVGMEAGFSDGSTQCHFYYALQNQMAANTTLKLLDAEGKELLSYTPSKRYSSVTISTPLMEENGTYTLLLGEEEITITLSGNSNVSGGTSGQGFGGGKGGFGNFFNGKDGNSEQSGGRGNRGDKGQMPEIQDGEVPEMPEGMTPPEGMEPGEMPEIQ